MLYQRLGETGLVVSRLAFGAMTFGSQSEGPMSHIFQVDQKGADAMVGRSLDAGVNFFDTADAYAGGQSEEMLGKALGKRRKDVVITTKVGFRTGDALVHTGLSYAHIVASAQESLRRLGTDWIDLYLIHRRDPHTPLDETMQALDDLVRRGLVRYVGYSNLESWEAAQTVAIQRERHAARFVAAQMYYSLVGRDIERDTVPFLHSAGIGLMVWSPLAGGFLTGKYTRENPDGGKGRLASFDFLPTDRERGYRLIDVMTRIARGHERSIAQVALAWLLAKSHVTSVILGASKISQLEDNLAAADLRLSAQEVQELDQITAPEPHYPGWFNQRTDDAKVKSALGLA